MQCVPNIYFFYIHLPKKHILCPLKKLYSVCDLIISFIFLYFFFTKTSASLYVVCSGNFWDLLFFKQCKCLFWAICIEKYYFYCKQAHHCWVFTEDCGMPNGISEEKTVLDRDQRPTPHPLPCECPQPPPPPPQHTHTNTPMWVLRYHFELTWRPLSSVSAWLPKV